MIPKMDAQAETMARAHAVCDKEPLQRAVLDELLHVEHHGTESGYDVTDVNNTHVFQMAISRDTTQAASAPLRVLSTLVRYVAITMDQSVPEALELVSMALCNPELRPMPTGLEKHIERALSEYELIDGWEVYGFGVVSQARSVRADSVDAEALANGTLELDGHPDMCPVWYAHLVGTDGRVWSVLRQEGYEVVYGTNGPDEPVIGVPESDALIRLLNRVTGQ